MNKPPSNSTPFLDCREGVARHRTHLPHWQQEDRLQFVTWSLGDAVPGPVLRQWKTEKDEWLVRHPKPWSEQDVQEYGRLFGERVDAWLDRGQGSCLLGKAGCAEVVAQVLLKSREMRVRLDAFVVMPNHVHVLFQVVRNQRLEKILQEWKGVSSHRINQYLDRKGTVWMRDYWDRMIRSPEHYRYVRRYILDNPAKARLGKGLYLLWAEEEPLWDTLKKEGYVVRDD